MGAHNELTSAVSTSLIYGSIKGLEVRDIHVTVHRNRVLLNNQPDALIIQMSSS
jgi:hypothetical protein